MPRRTPLIDHGPTVYAAVIAVVLIVLGLLVQVRETGPVMTDATALRVHFIDLLTEEVFISELRDLPPIVSPAGNRAVIAHLFVDPKDRSALPVIGHYERYTEPARLGAVRIGGYVMRPFEGREVSKDAVTWFSAASDEGAEIMTSPLNDQGDPLIRVRAD